MNPVPNRSVHIPVEVDNDVKKFFLFNGRDKPLKAPTEKDLQDIQEAEDTLVECVQKILSQWEGAPSKVQSFLAKLKEQEFGTLPIDMETWEEWTVMILKAEDFEVKARIEWDHSNPTKVNSNIVQFLVVNMLKRVPTPTYHELETKE